MKTLRALFLGMLLLVCLCSGLLTPLTYDNETVSQATVTSIALGYERYSECYDLDFDRNGDTYCVAHRLFPTVKATQSWAGNPITAFIAKWMSWWIELTILLTLFIRYVMLTPPKST